MKLSPNHRPGNEWSVLILAGMELKHRSMHVGSYIPLPAPLLQGVRSSAAAPCMALG